MSIVQDTPRSVDVSYEGGRHYVIVQAEGGKKRLPCHTKMEAERLAAAERKRLGL